MIATDLLVAGRNLLRHSRRNLFLGAAIAAVAALLVLFLGLVDGTRAAMMESATTVMCGHVNVGGFFKITSGSSAPLVTDWPRVMEDVRRLVPEIDYATIRGRGYVKAISDSDSMDLVLSGIQIAKERRFRRVVQVIDGKLDDLGQPNTIMLSEKQAERLKVKAGDALTLSAPTARGVNNTVDVRVVAVMRSIGLLSNIFAFLPEESLRRLYQLNDRTTGAIHLFLKDPAQAPQVMSRLLEDLRRAGYRVMDHDAQPYWMKLFAKVNSEDWTGQKLDVTTWLDEVSFLDSILKVVSGLATILISVLLFIVVVGIMNTLWIAIRERTREIGTLRAIGMQRTKVLWLFLLEATLLALAGATVGVLAGWGAGALLNLADLKVNEGLQMLIMQDHLSVVVHPRALAGYVAFITLLTAVGALLPSLRAARLRPVTAMHHIG
ncbi:MAG TPA: FtsX-like permease family protein [Anaeromyxobacteraceae bacterium]|nr:FtsX-like permease family protein [Anaeromyxobacteraceae bacterium]